MYLLYKEGISLKITKRDVALIIICVVMVVFQVWMDLSIPAYMSDITTLIQTPNSEVSEITSVGIKMLSCSILSVIASVITIFASSKLSATVGKRLHTVVFNKVIDFNCEEIEKFSVSSLLTRTIRDVESIKHILVIGLQVCIKAPILFVWALLRIIDKAWQWSTITVCAVVIILGISAIATMLVVPRYKRIEELVDKASRITRESLNGIRVIRAYNAEKHQEESFKEVNDELLKHNLFAEHLLAIISPVLSCVLSAISLVVYWTGAFIIAAAADPEKLVIFSDMIVYSTYSLQVISAFMLIGGTLMSLPNVFVHINRIKEVMNAKINITTGNTVLSEPIATIEFKDVSFTYPEEKESALKNISFKINKGETVAIIGATGSGKSSLANLILRMYDVTEGEVLINDKNIKNLQLEDIKNKIGYVSQKAILFSGNIAENITYGRAEDLDKINAVLDIAQASDFVSELKEKEYANVAQNGSNYSGGQKQRLSIARALYKNPEVLIFDDSFSALDYKTDSKLRSDLDEKMKNTTKIIIAQRIGTIKKADKILVLDRGELIGMGTHESLLTDCPIYKEIALSQLTEEELL